MKLEAVRGVSVGDMGLEIRWQIDDIDCAEWAFLGTDTTSNAKELRYECDLICGFDFYTHFTCTLRSALEPVFQI